MAEVSGTGQGGKSLNDRKLAAEVRTLGLRKIKKILTDKPVDDDGRRLHDAVLIKLAGTLLPRLNEHTGSDGEPLFDNDKGKKAISGFIDNGDN